MNFGNFFLSEENVHIVNIMYETLHEKFQEFREKQFEFKGMVICSNLGEILFSTESMNVSTEDCQTILDTWLHNKDELLLKEIRYTILKSDIYQYAALNPPLKLGIVGSMDREYNYAIGFVEAEKNPDNSLLISSIELNKLVWNIN